MLFFLWSGLGEQPGMQGLQLPSFPASVKKYEPRIKCGPSATQQLTMTRRDRDLITTWKAGWLHLLERGRHCPAITKYIQQQ